jgi:hypothetical protein
MCRHLHQEFLISINSDDLSWVFAQEQKNSQQTFAYELCVNAFYWSNYYSTPSSPAWGKNTNGFIQIHHLCQNRRGFFSSADSLGCSYGGLVGFRYSKLDCQAGFSSEGVTPLFFMSAIHFQATSRPNDS